MMSFFSRGNGGGESPHTASPPTPSTPASPYVSAGPARPIRFVYTDEKGKFQIDPEAVALLQLVKEPVGVVSVCGRARQGKSFILNQLLGRSSGFHVASTHRPCTKGLWLWSTPLRRTSIDGTVYNLLLLDSEGIDAYDQTGTYSTQIFSLAVLLSSMFVYNQMGGIDEAALDRISLVTEMTKRIRVRAGAGRNTASELGQFAPTFVWLLRDFYLDLVEDNRRITPRDYLELALRPVQGGGKDVASKNEIRESIRALFPDRECYTLVRPLSNENDLQRLDQIALDKLRPEFRAGLDAFTRFVFERTMPKQVGGVVMTGPILARIAQSFIDALNKGAVPTITSSWQSVEEAECQRAYELGTEIYMSSFDRSKHPDEDVLRDAHEEASQKSMDTFNENAVGTGPVREKYEKRLKVFLRKAFEDIKKDAFREAYLQCTNTVENMDKELRMACRAPDAKVDTVLKVLDGLLSKYEATCHGPEKWKREVIFLQQSLEGPLLDFIKRQLDQVGSEKTSLALKCRSIEDKLGLLNKQLEASEQHKSEYMKRYEDAMNDKKKLSDDYRSRIADWQKKCTTLEEKNSSLSKTLDTTRHESIDWRRKYDMLLSKLKSEEEQAHAEVAMLRSRCSAAEARLDASQEKAQAANEEAEEWKRKYNAALDDAKNAREKAAAAVERTNIQARSRENDLRAEFSESLAEKDNEIKEKETKIQQADQRLSTLNLELKATESKIKNLELETSKQKLEIKELSEKIESTNAAARSAENRARELGQENIYLNQKYRAQLDQIEELQERCKTAEGEYKRATELADQARADAATAQKEKSDLQRVAMERLAIIERAERHADTLERQKADLANEVERHKAAERDALFKVEILDERIREKEKEIDSLLQSNDNQRKNTAQVLESLLQSEREAHAEANSRAESLSVKLQATQRKLDELSQELNALRFGDKSGRNASHAKRGRTDDYEMGFDSVQDTGTNDKTTRANKKSKSTTSPLKFNSPEDGGSVFRVDEPTDSQQTNTEDYTKFTVLKLRQLLTHHNYGDQLLQLKNPNKKDLLALYEKCILKK